MLETVAKARDLAYRAHAGQTDKSGRPYIEHVERVAAAVSDDPIAEAAAMVHDVLEDCPGYEDEFWSTLPPEVTSTAEKLTRKPDQSAEDYYAEIRLSPRATRVKLADIADNSDEVRLSRLDQTTANRLRRKYAKARKALTG